MKRSTEERNISNHIVRIDRTNCIGSGNCVNVAPDVFTLGRDSIVTFVDEPDDIETERLIEACDLCPVDALFVTGPDGEQIVP